MSGECSCIRSDINDGKQGIGGEGNGEGAENCGEIVGVRR
jgi:hypothetical protein